jgi:hypothetical protein
VETIRRGSTKPVSSASAARSDAKSNKIQRARNPIQLEGNGSCPLRGSLAMERTRKRLRPYRDNAFDNSGWAQPFSLDDVESLFLHLL